MNAWAEEQKAAITQSPDWCDARELDDRLGRRFPRVGEFGWFSRLRYMISAEKKARGLQSGIVGWERRNAEGARIGPAEYVHHTTVAEVEQVAERLERTLTAAIAALSADAGSSVYVPDMRPCDRPHCIHDMHERLSGEQLGQCELEPIRRALYEVQAFRDDRTGRWEPYLNPDGLEGAPAPAVLAAVGQLASDFVKMQGRCDELNTEAAPASHSNPTTTVVKVHREMRPCVVAACVKGEHEWNGDEQSDVCELKAMSTDAYTVVAYRFDGEWSASAGVDPDIPAGPEGLELLRTLSDDFARMQAECDRLNAAALTGRTV